MNLDKDLAARQEARILCRQSEKAQKILRTFSQEQLDKIVEAVATAFSAAAEELTSLENNLENYYLEWDELL